MQNEKYISVQIFLNDLELLYFFAYDLALKSFLGDNIKTNNINNKLII